MAKGPKKPKAKDISRRRKKKVSVLTQEGIGYVDWKDINLLRRFMSDRAKIRARQVTGNNQQQQKEIARAIKNAREMALLPYNNRITTQRSAGRMRDDSRIDGPAPQPTAPPPGMRPGGEMDGDELEPMDMGPDAMAMEAPPEGGMAPEDAVAPEANETPEANAEAVPEPAEEAAPEAEEAPAEPTADEAVEAAPEAEEAAAEAEEAEEEPAS